MTFDPINPAALGEPRGWTNGMLGPPNGRVLFVAGQDAAMPEGEVTTDDFVEQFDIALRKMLDIVNEAGGDASSIGRMTVFVTDMDAYRDSRRAIGEIWKTRMGRVYPAMALMEVSRLVDPRGKVEIEATAILVESGDPDVSAG